MLRAWPEVVEVPMDDAVSHIATLADTGEIDLKRIVRASATEPPEVRDRLRTLLAQVPATVEVAVPGKAPDPMPGVRFCARPYSRRERRLTPVEVAVLEVLRDPQASEASWAQIVDRLRELITHGEARVEVLAAEAATEPRVKARERWAAIAT